tara:strand:- start:286 stop:567 length:282 start_codon:yes stop_codon:yes gene_type:complete
VVTSPFQSIFHNTHLSSLLHAILFILMSGLANVFILPQTNEKERRIDLWKIMIDNVVVSPISSLIGIANIICSRLLNSYGTIDTAAQKPSMLK